jgi:ribonuclease BN (tRNA processing enzyme)
VTALELTILGSGTAVPVVGRFPAGVLVRGGGETVLVDAGPGVLRRLAETGLDLGDVTAVLLTHFHTDHCADVAALLFALRNPRYRGRGPLRIRAAAGLRAWLDHLVAAWPWLRPRGDYDLEVEEIQPGPLPLGGLEVTAIPIRHTAQSLGYRIAAAGGGPTIALSGDADVCPELDELARGADLFVCDSAFPDAHRTEGHLTPGLAGVHAARARAKVLCLTHFYPECDGHDLAAEAARTFTGKIVLARDLMRFELG